MEAEMINITAPLITLSLYILIWEKLPYWGTWFNALLDRSPRWVRVLYAQWRCPFCVAFWIALLLRFLLGLSTLPDLQVMASNEGWPIRILIVFFDCLSCATLVYIGQLLISAVLASTLRGYELRADYQRRLLLRPSSGNTTPPVQDPSP